MHIEPTVLAYLAGIIDGDGFISITRSKPKPKCKEYFGAQVGISGTRREPHDLAASLWGGSVNSYKPKNPAHRIQYQWCRVGESAAVVIEAVYPYLLIKKPHAELALELHEAAFFASGDDPFPWFSPDFDGLGFMREMRERMIELNQSRNRLRVGKSMAGRLLDGRMTLTESFRARSRDIAELIRRLESTRPPAWNTLAALRHQERVSRWETEFWRARWQAEKLERSA